MLRTMLKGRTRVIAAVAGASVLAGILFAVAPAPQDVLSGTGPIDETPFVIGGATIPTNTVNASFGQPITIADGQAIGLHVGGIIVGIVNNTGFSIVVTPKATDSSGNGALVVSIQLPSGVTSFKVELFRPGGQAAEETIICDANPCEVSIPDGWIARITR